jgi:hypothetical protein
MWHAPVNTSAVRFETVRDAIDESGCEERRGIGRSLLVWLDAIKFDPFTHRVQQWQVVNRIPGSNVLCRKVLFELLMRQTAALFPSATKCIPESYILLNEINEFMEKRANSTFFLKPNRGSLGHGIVIVKPNSSFGVKTLTVAQKMIEPFLLDNRKFDLRLYVLVSSVRPFRIFIYRDGLARFCAEEYGSDSIYSNITNVTLNMEYPGVEIASISRLISEVFPELEARGVDTAKLWKKIDAAVLVVMFSAHRFMMHGEATTLPSYGYPRCFQIFGFDVILDKHLEPYVLEVNYRPLFDAHRPQERRMKENVLRDAMSISMPSRRICEAFMARKWSSLSWYTFLRNHGREFGNSGEEVVDAMRGTMYEPIWPQPPGAMHSECWRILTTLDALPVKFTEFCDMYGNHGVKI